MNLVAAALSLPAAAFNLACAVVWGMQGEHHLAAMSIFGAWASLTAYRWARE